MNPKLTGKNTGNLQQFGGSAVLLLVVVSWLAGCGKSEPKSAVIRNRPAADGWSVTENDPTLKTPALLWNGLIGVRLGRDGTTGTRSDLSQAMFFADGYQLGGEEKILAHRGLLNLEIVLGKERLSPARGSDYRQRLDFRNGLLSTSWRQAVAGGHASIEVRTAVHPELRQIAQSWIFLGPPGVDASIWIPDPPEVPVSGAQPRAMALDRRLRLLHGVDGEDRIEFEGGWEGQFEKQVGGFEWRGRMLGSKMLQIHRTFRVADGAQALPGMRPAGAEPVEGNVRREVELCFKASEAAGAKRTETDIEIDGPVDDQQALRSFLFYLRTAIPANGKNSIAPMGLSSDQYFGHIFWDADIWVFPALALLDPDRSVAIPRYRFDRMGAAAQNFKAWIEDGRPTGKGQLGVVGAQPQRRGLKFPWESSVTGKETVPGPSKFQDHISGTVAFSCDMAAGLGLVPESLSDSLGDGVAEFYRFRSERRPDGQFVLKGTMSPDEHHIGDNDLYTNLLAQWCLNGRRFSTSSPRQSSISNDGRKGGVADNDQPDLAGPKMFLPRDAKSFLTYDGDPVRSYKQAAAVLAIFPLQFPEAEKQARVMMDRFAAKVTANGPAMSDSVHALIWARIGEEERAYETWRRSWQDFTRQPLLLFSEKRKKEATYFTTGAAGCLQTVLYGFLGFRIDDRAQEGSAWSTPLKGGKVLSIRPRLPAAWRTVRLRNFWVMGKRYSLEATASSVTVKPS